MTHGLRSRLILSHTAVAAIGGLATYVIVRWLAPTLFDHGAPAASGRGPLAGSGLRAQVSAAVDQALLVGSLVGFAVAAAIGVLAAWRVSRSMRLLGAATRRIARGDYRADLPRESITELATLATDVADLGASLADTEARRVRLLGEVAHEVRTPLTVIDGHVEAMIDQVLPSGPAELGVVSAEVRRLRRLADDLSTLSRAEEGRLGIALRRVDVAPVVRDAVSRLAPQASDAGITLQWNIPTDPVPVEADADRIAQVVTNLVGNSLRATPADGRVLVEVTTADRRATIRVVDTGEGLAEADLERIFDRFYRVPGRHPAASGSGIGLTISRRITAAHHGTLTASSAGLGRGATFTVELPLAPRA